MAEGSGSRRWRWRLAVLGVGFLLPTTAAAELVDLAIVSVVPVGNLRRGGPCNEVSVEVINHGPDRIRSDEPGYLELKVLDRGGKEHWATPYPLTEIVGLGPNDRQTYTLRGVHVPSAAVTSDTVWLRVQIHVSHWHGAGDNFYQNNVDWRPHSNVGGCPGGGGGGGGNEPPPDNRDLAQRAFNDTLRIFQHERCTNCHAGTTLSPGHNPTMIAGRPITPADCATCHHVPSTTNPIAGSGRGGPVPLSSHPAWHMAPMGMELTSSMSAHDICEQVKRNTMAMGDRAQAEAVADHAERDDLVRWGFEPKCSDSAGTATVACSRQTPAPGSHADFVRKLREWASYGGACP